MITDIAGLSLRVHAGGTGPAALMAPIANAVYALNGMDEMTTVAELENWLGHVTEGFDPTQDLALVEVDGALVAYGWVEWVDTTEGTREFRLGGYVHPDWQSRGIGRRLLAWQEEHARTHRRGHRRTAALLRDLVVRPERPQGAPLHALRLRGGALLLRDESAQPRRHRACRRCPRGWRSGPIGSDRASLKQMWDADAEAFQDHWGGFDASDAAFEAWLTDPMHRSRPVGRRLGR